MESCSQRAENNLKIISKRNIADPKKRLPKDSNFGADLSDTQINCVAKVNTNFVGSFFFFSFFLHCLLLPLALYYLVYP